MLEGRAPEPDLQSLGMMGQGVGGSGSSPLLLLQPPLKVSLLRPPGPANPGPVGPMQAHSGPFGPIGSISTHLGLFGSRGPDLYLLHWVKWEGKQGDYT